MLVREASRAPRQATPGTLRTPAPAPIDAVVVSASHYQFGEEPAFSPTVFGSAELESLPDIGEDPIRVLARLPGVAGQDFSSKVHLRGGTEDETLVRFDDLRLYNPYHLKDFFGVFSSIDPAIVSDVRVYTGGFPRRSAIAAAASWTSRRASPRRISRAKPSRPSSPQVPRSKAALPMAPATGRSPPAAATWTLLRPRRLPARRTGILRSLRSRRPPPERLVRDLGECARLRRQDPSPSTATRKRRRSPSTGTSTTGCGWTSARRMGSAAACWLRTPCSKASEWARPTCRESAPARSLTRGISRLIRSRRMVGGDSALARCCRPASNGASRADATTTPTKRNSRSFS